MLTIQKRLTNTLTVAWQPPANVQDYIDLFTPTNITASAIIYTADLVLLVDNNIVGYAKISNETTAVNFSLNLNSLNERFTIKALLLQQLNTLFDITPVTLGNDSNAAIYQEELIVDLRRQGLSCGVNLKSAKIDPTFDWLQTLSEGLTASDASELLNTWREFKPFYWDDTFVLDITIPDSGFSSEEFSVELPLEDKILASCPCPKYHGDYTGVYRGTIPKCLMPAPTVMVIGTPGNALYAYAVAPIVPNRVTNASPITTVADGAAVLTNNNYNQISWEAVPNATAYSVYRIRISGYTSAVDSGLLEIVSGSITSYNDVGLAVQTSTSTLAQPYYTYSTTGTYTWSVVITVDGVDYPLTGTITVT